MFEDNNNILNETNYQTVSPSPNRIFNILKNSKTCFIHIVTHHVLQIIALFICLIIISSTFAVTEHTTGIGCLIAELIFSVVALVLYCGYIPLLVFAFRTHPILIADANGKSLFFKLANLVHALYVATLAINVILSVLLSFSFNPTGKLHNHKTDGLWGTYICLLLFIQLSCGEIQKPLIFITRKLKTVDISIDQLETEEPLKETNFADKIGVFTLGYNILGFQSYVKYHFDPNQPTIQPEIYFCGWVKNF